MAKLLKFLSILLAAIVLLLAIMIGGVMIFINPNDYKAEISDQVYKMTGRTLTIQGDIKWSFFPWVGLEVNDVTLSNAQGFGNKPFAQLGHAKASIKLLPLIKAEIEANNLTLENVTVNLMKNAQGQTNYNDLLKPQSAKPAQIKQPAATTPTTQQPKQIPAFLVSNIVIQNTTINLQDKQNNTNNSYTIQELDSRNINLAGKTFPITLIVSMKSHTTGQTINTKLDTNINLDAKQQTAQLSDFSLVVNNMQLKGNVTAKNILSDNLSYQATVSLTNFNANAFIQSIDNAIQFKQPSALQSVKADAQIIGTMNSINISQLTAKVDNTNINATVNLSNMQRLIGNFSVDLDKINLDNYQIITNNTNTTTSTKTSKAVATATPATSYQVPFIHSNLNGDFSAKSITVSKITMTNVDSNISLQQGVVTIGPISAKVYDGQLNATLIADYTRATPKYIVNETLNGVQINGLISAMQGSSRISGIANVNANITAKGSDNTAILRSLNGNAGFSISSGQIQGFQVMQALNTAASTFFRQPSSNGGNNATQFSNTTATFNIKNGVAATNDLVLNSPVIKVTGNGSIDLVTQRLNMSLDVTALANMVPAIANLQKQIGGSIPLNVGGTLSNPQVSPDMQKITIAAAKNKIGEQVDKLGKDLNKTGKDLGKQIKSLFN